MLAAPLPTPMRVPPLYVRVLIAIAVGGLLGHFAPRIGVQLKPLAEAFVALIRMLVAPIIFLTVVVGVANVADIKKVGRTGAKALLYFEVLSSIALLVGWGAGTAFRPGAGFHVDASSLDAQAVAKYAKQAHEHGAVSFMMSAIPSTFFDAFGAGGSLIQVLLLALLFGFAMSSLGPQATPVLKLFESLSQIFFRMIGYVMKLAPLGAGAAMAFTLGAYGLRSLAPMLKLMLCFYASCTFFVFVVLGPVAHWAGFSLIRFLRYIREELLLVVGTSSSESALVPLMQKLERLGCSKSVVGLVVPSGYSFNLDGTNLYLTLAALFVAQALDIPLSGTQQLSLLGVALLTSKGAAGVTGSGFITLASTLAVVPSIPVAGLALLLGVDRFMSEARALTNMIGNGVACLVVAKWEGALDGDVLQRELKP